MDTVKERLKYFLKNLVDVDGKNEISEGKFEKMAGLGNGAVTNMGDNPTQKTLNKIKIALPAINTDWLLTGQGNPVVNDKENQRNESKITSGNPVPERSKDTLEELLSISKMYAQAHQNFSDAHKNFSLAHLKEQENNTELIGMVKQDRITVHEYEETQSILNAKLLVLQELLLKMGVGKKLWDSPDEGRAILHKHVTDAILGDASTDIHVHAGKQHKQS